MTDKLASTARTGRDNQRESALRYSRCLQRSRALTLRQCLSTILPNVLIGYGAQGERLVAGVVPLSEDKTDVLLIQSTRRGGWVLPKGGWETDEEYAKEAARREAWEEAGIVCEIQKNLGEIPDKRPANQLTPQAPKAIFLFFQANVLEMAQDWPEKQKRIRKWMSYQEAEEALKSRPELLDALNKSEIER